MSSTYVPQKRGAKRRGDQPHERDPSSGRGGKAGTGHSRWMPDSPLDRKEKTPNCYKCRPTNKRVGEEKKDKKQKKKTTRKENVGGKKENKQQHSLLSFDWEKVVEREKPRGSDDQGRKQGDPCSLERKKEKRGVQSFYYQKVQEKERGKAKGQKDRKKTISIPQIVVDRREKKTESVLSRPEKKKPNRGGQKKGSSRKPQDGSVFP